MFVDEPIERDPVALDFLPTTSFDFQTQPDSTWFENIPEDVPPVPPRREYVWRTIDRGEQSLASVARRMALELDFELTPMKRRVSTGVPSPHRCAGYVREEITLAMTKLESAIVSHDAPSLLEICSVCGEVVASHEVFNCICGDPGAFDSIYIVSSSFTTFPIAPGARSTVKCRECKQWSHVDCVQKQRHFTCQVCDQCMLSASLISQAERFLLAGPSIASSSQGPEEPLEDADSPQDSPQETSREIL
jgi:hypothetical protein